MTRLWMLGIFAFVALASMAQAQAVKLSPDELDALLTGNTAIGSWEGATYRQYFGADGVTIYAQEGARSARGEWRIDEATQEYQSIWPGDADWQGWFVMEHGDTYYWVSKATPPTPFQVLRGEQLVAPDCDALRRFAETGERFALNGALPRCSTSKTLGGGSSEDCFWRFEFRSERAIAGFAKLADHLKACSAYFSSDPEPRVNHPDSFEQVHATMGTVGLRLSLKDKAALSESLVFLKRRMRKE